MVYGNTHLGEKKINMEDKEQPTFNLEELFRFGYYVRKNPTVVMRKNYLNWKEELEKENNEKS